MCHRLCVGLLIAAGALVVFWLAVCLLLWHYGTPQPAKGEFAEFLDTPFGGGRLIGYCFADWVALSYLHHPRPPEVAAPWIQHTYRIVGVGWIEVAWMPTLTASGAPSGEYGNVDVGIRCHAPRMLLLSMLAFLAVLLPVALRRGWIRRRSSRGFEPVLRLVGAGPGNDAQ